MLPNMPSSNNDHCNADTHTKIGSGNHQDDILNYDLWRDYQTAVDCLKQCESVITSLQDQLASKDNQICSLEEKIVNMSLELASSKAFEDEHRSMRRNPSFVPDTKETINKKERQHERRCSCSSASMSSLSHCAAAGDMMSIERRLFDLRSSMGLDSELSSELVSDESLRSSSMDISESSLSRLSQFFRKNKEGGGEGGSKHQVDSKGLKENEQQNDDTNPGPGLPKRRVTS